MTNREEIFDRDVMICSVNPSVKYSCFGNVAGHVFKRQNSDRWFIGQWISHLFHSGNPQWSGSRTPDHTIGNKSTDRDYQQADHSSVNKASRWFPHRRFDRTLRGSFITGQLIDSNGRRYVLYRLLAQYSHPKASLFSI